MGRGSGGGGHYLSTNHICDIPQYGTSDAFLNHVNVNINLFCAISYKRTLIRTFIFSRELLIRCIFLRFCLLALYLYCNFLFNCQGMKTDHTPLFVITAPDLLQLTYTFIKINESAFVIDICTFLNLINLASIYMLRERVAQYRKYVVNFSMNKRIIFADKIYMFQLTLGWPSP